MNYTQLACSVFKNYKKHKNYQAGTKQQTDFYQAETKCRSKKPGRGRGSR